jgi:uncharacterized protein involved in exopolysaccharide biosynthesis
MRLAWALRQKARLIALAVVISIPLGILAAFTLAPRNYVAQSVLVWEPVQPASSPVRELQTLTNSVKLPDNIAEVRQRLKLADSLESVGSRIQMDIVNSESNILTLSGKASTAEEAARFTQVVTDVFLEARLRIARARTEERLKAVTQEIELMLKQLSAARERYDQFRAQYHVVDFAMDRKAAIEELSFLRNEANKSRIEADSGSSKADLLRSAVQKAAPQLVLVENQVQADRQKLAELSAQLTARRASLSEEHPEVQGLQASVEALEQKSVDSYMVTGRQIGTNPEWMVLQEQLTSTSVDQQAAEKKWQSYARMQSSLSERVQQLTAVEGEANLLLTDIQLGEQRLSQLKAEQKVLESGVRQPSSELRVLNAPVPPPGPAQSSRRKMALAFPILTGLLAVGLFLGKEFRGIKMRAPSEIAYWAHLPVLASSSWPTEPDEVRNLALELAPQLDAALGKTLLVSLSPEQNVRASELVEALRAQSSSKSPSGPEDSLQLWDKADRVQALRRAARESRRVLVLVEAGQHSPWELAGVRRWLGRDDGIGLVVLGLGPELAQLRDRVGDVAGFWSPSLTHLEATASEQEALKEPVLLDRRQRRGPRR